LIFCLVTMWTFYHLSTIPYPITSPLPKQHGNRVAKSMTEITHESDNIYTMWHQAVSNDYLDILEMTVDCLYFFHRVRGTYGVIFALFKHAHDLLANKQISDRHIHLYIKLKTMMSLTAEFENQYSIARSIAEDALVLAMQHGLTIEVARSEVALCKLWAIDGDLKKAKEYGEKGFMHYQEIDNIDERANAAVQLGWVFQMLEEYDRAETLFKDLVQESEARENIYQAAQGNIWLALLYNLQKKYEQAKSHGLKALVQFEAANSATYAIHVRKNLAIAYWGTGEYEQARHYFLLALKVYIDAQRKAIPDILSTMSWMIYLMESEGDQAFAMEISEFILQ